MTAAIETSSLGRTFRRRPDSDHRRKGSRGNRSDVIALQDVDLRIPRGELFGLLGPNGAGKTTLIKILCTLLFPTSGTARVAGFDVVREDRDVRRRINMVSGSETPGYGIMTARENLWLFSQLYGIPGPEAKRRSQELLEALDLAHWADTKVFKLSTGLKQRLSVCRGFLTDPEVLFLDEPTLGLDVRSARRVRGFIRSWMAEDTGRTVLLTTHYMAEADELCDRIAVIDHGGVLACDTPEALKRRVRKGTVLELVTTPVATEGLAAIPGVAAFTRSDDAGRGRTRLHFQIADESAVPEIVDRVTRSGARVLDLRRQEPTLEDVFLQLVGRPLADGEEAEPGAGGHDP